MRPRQICRGMAKDETIEIVNEACFNEAPANLPGNAVVNESSAPLGM